MPNRVEGRWSKRRWLGRVVCDFFGHSYFPVQRSMSCRWVIHSCERCGHEIVGE